LTLEQAIAGFRDSLRGKSPATLRTYSTGVDRFLEFLKERGVGPDVACEALPADSLEAFYAWLVKVYGRESRATQQTYVSGVRALFRFLERRRQGPAGTSYEQIKDGLRQVMGRSSYRTPRIDSGLPLIVTYVNDLKPPAGSAAVVRAKRLELLRDRALLRTLYGTGLRRAELASLDRRDVDDGWADRAIVTGKGDKERVVFFDEPSLEAIRAYVKERADTYTPPFIRHDRGRGAARAGGTNYRLSAQTIFMTVKAYSKAVGVDVSPHDFRHTKASSMLNAGAKLSEVQDLLGHASPETTKKIYAHYELSHLREAFDKFSVPAEVLASRARKRRDAG
jgi:site-specific recombinase XerD